MAESTRSLTRTTSVVAAASTTDLNSVHLRLGGVNNDPHDAGDDDDEESEAISTIDLLNHSTNAPLKLINDQRLLSYVSLLTDIDGCRDAKKARITYCENQAEMRRSVVAPLKVPVDLSAKILDQQAKFVQENETLLELYDTAVVEEKHSLELENTQYYLNDAASNNMELEEIEIAIHHQVLETKVNVCDKNFICSNLVAGRRSTQRMESTSLQSKHLYMPLSDEEKETTAAGAACI